VTLEGQNSSGQQMAELLAALEELEDTHLIFTMPNADTGGRELASMVNDFVADHQNARVYTSLGQLRYLSCMKYVDVVVGNSSSGLAEAPSMGIATINIGDRQKGRLLASSVINCEPTLHSMREALSTVFSPSFQSKVKSSSNPYGNGGASEKIVEVLKNCDLNNLLKKSFFNMTIPEFGAKNNGFE
jgi:GDP/UDP-N,N'-diacetylbacillosamine 2-epimerase (hydrolysing)